MGFFEFGDKIWFMSHAGISNIPDNLIFISCNQFTHGVGKYDEIEQISDSWVKNTKENYYQVFGHRGYKDIQVNDRVYNLEGSVEFGDNLRILEIYKDKIIPVEVKNDIYNKNLVKYSERQLNKQKLDYNKYNSEFISSLKTNKIIYEKQFGYISSFNFKKDVFYKGTWNKCRELPRGFFINNISGEIISRGYLKSFNIEEKEETKINNLCDNLKYPVTLTRKENGFLGLLGYDSSGDNLVFCSKSTVDGTFAENFKSIFNSYNVDSDKLKSELKERNLCLTFEVIDPVKDPHIIKYSKPHLVLLDAFYRELETKKLDYLELLELGDKYGFSVKLETKVINNAKELKEFYNEVEESDSVKIEGWMLEDSEGYMVKYKTRYYRFWKGLRQTVHMMLEGKEPRDFNNPESARFIKFVKSEINNDKEKVKNMSIIDLRDLYYNLIGK
jgi:tRNA splicing ligase